MISYIIYRLLLLFVLGLDLLLITASFLRRIHLQEFKNLFVRDVVLGHKLHERKSVKANEVANEWMAARGADIPSFVDKRIRVHAPIANHCKSLLVREWL